MKDGCFGMKRDPLYDYKNEFLSHNVFRPYSNKQSQEEYMRLRSNEKSNLKFSHWEDLVYRGESDTDRNK